MEHYNKQYFQWQKQTGEFGGTADLFKFGPYIGLRDDVLDFGCGGGYILKNIRTDGTKYGVEINHTARKKAASHKGILCYEKLEELPDDCVDVAISNHALEHTLHPADVLVQLKRVVRPDGRIVIVVPNEVSKKVDENDVNMHLYTWTPQNLRNLFLTCGIYVKKSGRIYDAWPPKYQLFQKVFGWRIFRRLCKLTSLVRKQYQTICVGIVKNK